MSYLVFVDLLFVLYSHMLMISLSFFRSYSTQPHSHRRQEEGDPSKEVGGRPGSYGADRSGGRAGPRGRGRGSGGVREAGEKEESASARAGEA